MQIQFMASVSIITPDPPNSRRLFGSALGLEFESPPGDEYAYSDRIEGSKHFGLWPLSQAAQACFGTDTWPADRPVPQVSVEFDVESPEAVAAAARELEAKGYRLLHSARTEPWGQTLARIQSSEGAIIGISFTPTMHQQRD